MLKIGKKYLLKIPPGVGNSRYNNKIVTVHSCGSRLVLIQEDCATHIYYSNWFFEPRNKKELFIEKLCSK